MSRVVLTAEGIKAAAREFNAAYPPAMPLIDAGTPVIRVTCSSFANGRRVRAVVDPGVIAPDGTFIGADLDPDVLEFARADGREDAARNVRRKMRPRWNVQLLVEYVPVRDAGGACYAAMVRDDYQPSA